MKEMMDYVEALKARHNITSDRQLALYLGLKKQSVSHWKRRGCSVDTETAWRIAEGLGVDPVEIICASEVERAKRNHDTERARAWRDRLSAVSSSAGAVFFALALLPGAVMDAAKCILCQIPGRYPGRSDSTLPALQYR